MGSNALASYIVLACRPRPEHAPQTDRRAFVAERKRELPPALKRPQQGNIAPVDLAQAAIGPGKAIYPKYRRILDAKGRPMGVRVALALIKRTLTEVLAEAEDEYETIPAGPSPGTSSTAPRRATSAKPSCSPRPR